MVVVVEAVIGLPAPRVIAVDTVAITMAARHAAWALEQTAASSRSSRVSPAIPCEFVSPVALLPSPEDAARRFERLGTTPVTRTTSGNPARSRDWWSRRSWLEGHPIAALAPRDERNSRNAVARSEFWTIARRHEQQRPSRARLT